MHLEVTCLEVIWKGSIQYYAKCMLSFCNTLVVIVKYSSKTISIDRNLQKPVKCILQNTSYVFHIKFKRGKSKNCGVQEISNLYHCDNLYGYTSYYWCIMECDKETG